MIPETLINSGLAALQQGHHKQADASFKEALAVSQEAGIKSSSINALEGMASLAAALGEATRAARLWGAAEMARQVTAIALPPPERTLHEPYLASARFRLGRRDGKKRWPRGGRWRSKRSPSTPSLRRPISPWPRLGKIHRPKTNRWATLPPGS